MTLHTGALARTDCGRAKYIAYARVPHEKRLHRTWATERERRRTPLASMASMAAFCPARTSTTVSRQRQGALQPDPSAKMGHSMSAAARTLSV